MPRVDFYVLKPTFQQTADTFVCRLTNKIYQQQQKIYIHTRSATQTKTLDDLLWTFNDISFVPHATQIDTEAPVLLGYDTTPTTNTDVLINLANDIPSFSETIERNIEIVDQRDDAQRELARQHYRHYQDNGYELHTHELT